MFQNGHSGRNTPGASRRSGPSLRERAAVPPGALLWQAGTGGVVMTKHTVVARPYIHPSHPCLVSRDGTRAAFYLTLGGTSRVVRWVFQGYTGQTTEHERHGLRRWL